MRRGAFEPCFKAPVGERGDWQIVGEQRAVDGFYFADALVCIPVGVAGDPEDNCERQQYLPEIEVLDLMLNETSCTRQDRLVYGDLLSGKGSLSGGGQTVDGSRGQIVQPAVEVLPDLDRKSVV